MNKIIFNLIIFVILGKIPILNIFINYLVYRFAFKNGIDKTKTFVFAGSIILLLIDRFNLISLISIGFALNAYLFIKLSGKLEFNFRALILISGMIIITLLFFYQTVFNIDNTLSKQVYELYEQQKQEFQSEITRLEFENPGLDFDKVYKNAIDYTVKIFPGIMFTYIFLGTFFGILIFYYLFLMKKELSEFNIPDLKSYHINDNLIWFFIGVFAFNILIKNNFVHNRMLEYVIPNLMIIFLGIYFLQGIIICMYYLRKINFYLPVFIIIVLPFFMLISFIGVFDIWFDYRKIRTPNKKLT